MLYLPLESKFASILAAIHMLLPNCLYRRRCSKSKWFPCVPWGWWLPLPLLPPLGFLSTLHRKTIWRVSSPSSRCQTESNPSLTLRFHATEWLGLGWLQRVWRIITSLILPSLKGSCFWAVLCAIPLKMCWFLSNHIFQIIHFSRVDVPTINMTFPLI